MVKQAATGREHITATVAPHTRARIDAFCKATGMSKGQLLDLAVDALSVCDLCDGSGRVDLERCNACHGDSVVPR